MGSTSSARLTSRGVTVMSPTTGMYISDDCCTLIQRIRTRDIGARRCSGTRKATILESHVIMLPHGRVDRKSFQPPFPRPDAFCGRQSERCAAHVRFGSSTRLFLGARVAIMWTLWQPWQIRSCLSLNVRYLALDELANEYFYNFIPPFEVYFL